MENYENWHLINGIGLRYKLVSRSGSFGYEDASCQEEYIIRSGDLLAFILYAFPEPVVIGGSIQYPQQPVMPGLGTLVPKRVTFKSHEPGLPVDPFGADPGWEGSYSQFIRLVVDYGPTPENDGPQDPNDEFTFLELSANASGTLMNAPLPNNENTYWEVPEGTTFSCTGDEECTGESGEILETNIPYGVNQTQVEWTLRWPRIPFQFFTDTVTTRLRDKLGKVNDTPMRVLHNSPADTILFLSFAVTTNYTWRQGKVGQAPVTLDMKFLETNFEDAAGTLVTHQHIYRPGFGWRKLIVNGENIYQQTDLNKIWRGD